MAENKVEKKARKMARRAALTPEERAKEDKSAKKTKLIALIILVLFIVIGYLFPDSNSGSNDASSNSTSPVCSEANSEDLKNLKDGVKNKSLSLSNGFVGEFEANDIEDIKAIFPTYIKPRVVAAQINVPGDGIVIGLWGIQKFDYGWKILGLNEEAKKYSIYGADTADNSASGRVRSKMLELSPNTSALDCATAAATPAVSDSSGVDWSNYASSVKTRIESLIQSGDCSNLQKEFDIADQNDTAQRNRVGVGNADLMNYLNKEMQKLGCY